MKQETDISLYEIYQRRHNELIQIAQDQSSIIRSLGLDEIQKAGTKQGEIVQGLIERLKSESLKVLIIGKFNTGKSTFVNALLGESLLPSSPKPTTGVLCEIRYATEADSKILLFPKPGMGKKNDDLPVEISKDDLEQELKKYIVIDHEGDSSETSRYKKLELHWPLLLCKNGVELIDSVGLDDPDARDEITLNHVQTVDAILYCMSSLATYSAKDVQILGLLKSLGYESIMFVITWYDQIKESVDMGEISEEEWKRLQFKNLAQWSELGKDGVKFVDSKSALKGRIKGQNDLIQSSGILELEKSLERFLVEEKGRAKLLTTLRSLRAVNRYVRQIIPNRIGMLQTSIEELEKRYRNAEIPLKNLETKKQLLISHIDNAITDISREAFDLANAYFVDLPEKINSWADEYEIESKIGFIPQKSTLEPMVKEVIGNLKLLVEQNIAQWNQDELAPMIESKMETLQESLEEEAREFIESIDKLRVEISVGEQVDEKEIAEQEEPSTLGRLAAGGWGILTGDFVSGGMGMVMGVKALVNTLVGYIVAAVIVVVFNVVNPVAIIAILASAIAGGQFANRLSLKRAIRTKVGEKFANEISANTKELCSKIEGEVKKELNKFNTSIANGLSGEISSVRDEVEEILEERKKSKTDTDREIKKLRTLESKNTTIEEKLDELLYEAGLVTQII